MCKNRKKYREYLQRQEAKQLKQEINCAYKVSYNTKHAAEEAAKLFRKRFNTPQNVYHCSICGKYHLTNKEVK